MSDHQSASKHPLFEFIVEKLSPQNSSWDAMFAKLSISWAGFFAGLTLSDVFTLASLFYVMLNIYVLIRDKIVKKPKTADSQLPSGD